MAYPTDPPDYCSDNASASSFWRRGWHGSTVYTSTSGLELIIDGGELRVLSDGTPVPAVANSTYMISLSHSWRPDEVKVKCLPKTVGAIYNKPALWPSFVENDTVYTFNGARSQSYPREQLPGDLPVRPAMWSFTGGSWTLAATPPTPLSAGAAFTYGSGTAYFLGGTQSWTTSRQIYEEYGKGYMTPSEGLIMFNDPTWASRSIQDYISTGWLWEANMEYVPMFASNGLIVAMGGTTAYDNDPNTPNFLPYNFVGVYNPFTDQWRNQSTSGAIPAGRRRSCTVGVPGDNGTFEVS
jgi:hypothetical protein